MSSLFALKFVTIDQTLLLNFIIQSHTGLMMLFKQFFCYYPETFYEPIRIFYASREQSSATTEANH